VDLCNTHGHYGLAEHVTLQGLTEASGYDLTIVVEGHQAHAALPAGARLPSTKAAVILTDEPYHTARTSLFSTGANEGRYDVVASQDDGTTHMHPHGLYLPVAWDPHLKPTMEIEPGSEMFDVGWVGTTEKRRRQWLRSLDWELRGRSWLRIGAKQKSLFCDRERSYYQRVRIAAGAHFFSPEQCIGFYRLCRLVLNVHRDAAGVVPAVSPNPRLYECMGFGLPCLNDARSGFPSEIISFETPQEMGAFAREYLDGSANAQKRVREAVEAGLALAPQHTYAARWATLRQALGL